VDVILVASAKPGLHRWSLQGVSPALLKRQPGYEIPDLTAKSADADRRCHEKHGDNGFESGPIVAPQGGHKRDDRTATLPTWEGTQGMRNNSRSSVAEQHSAVRIHSQLLSLPNLAAAQVRRSSGPYVRPAL